MQADQSNTRPAPPTLANLGQQLQLLADACKHYGPRNEDAAIGIAQILCSLFRDDFQTKGLLARLVPDDLQIASSCLPIPPGAQHFSQGLSELVDEADNFRCQPRCAAGMPAAPMRLLPWRDWWDEEPVYVFQGEGVPRSLIARGCANAFDGFRIAIPYGGGWAPLALSVAGEDEPWPSASVQLADVRQMAHEVLASQALQQLLA